MMTLNLEDFRRRLDALSARLRGDLEVITDEARHAVGGHESGELSNAPMHLADAGTEEYLHDLSALFVENKEALIEEVDAARQRLDEGRFGTCEECNKPIPQARLEALPYARYCVPCAEVHEADEQNNLDEGRPSARIARSILTASRLPVAGFAHQRTVRLAIAMQRGPQVVVRLSAVSPAPSASMVSPMPQRWKQRPATATSRVAKAAAWPARRGCSPHDDRAAINY